MLEILVYPDERLKQVGRPVENFDEELRTFVAELEATMRASEGVSSGRKVILSPPRSSKT